MLGDIREVLNNYPFLAGIFTIGIPAAVGIWRVFTMRKTQRDIAADQLFRSYLSSAIAYPRLAAPGLFNIGKLDAEEWVRYTYFVADMLHAFETILMVSKSAPGWRSAINSHLSYHWRFFGSDDFKPTLASYEPELQTMIVRAVAAKKKQASARGAAQDTVELAPA